MKPNLLNSIFRTIFDRRETVDRAALAMDSVERQGNLRMRGRIWRMATAKKTLAILSEQTNNADGSITIRARRVADEREIGAGEAAAILGFSDRGTIYRLIELGSLNGWKPMSARGNARWRISLQSVLSYREKRISATSGGF